MGTNYYLQKKDPKTGRVKDMHICKTSGGWTPSMQGYIKDSYNDIEIKTWLDWKLFLRDQLQNKEGLIFDEYDDLWAYTNFVRYIEGWQDSEMYHGRSKKNHAECALRGDFDSWEDPNLEKNNWIDPEGYSFGLQEFS